MAINQLSKGVVRAKSVQADSVLIGGQPALTALTETDAVLADLFPDAPIEITGDRTTDTIAIQTALLAALDTLGLITDSTTAS